MKHKSFKDVDIDTLMYEAYCVVLRQDWDLYKTYGGPYSRKQASGSDFHASLEKEFILNEINCHFGKYTQNGLIKLFPSRKEYIEKLMALL